MRGHLAALTVLVPATLLSANDAGAQEVSQWGPAFLNEGSVDRAVTDVELAFYGDATFYAGSLNTTDLLSFDPSFGALARFARVFGVQFHLPVVFGHADPNPGDLRSHVGLGNPYFWLGYAGDIEIAPDLRMRLRAGVGFALPAAELDRRDLVTTVVSALAYVGGSATHGAWDAFLYIPDSWALSIPVSAELRIGEMGYVATDFAFWHASIDDAPDITALQLAFEGGLQPLDWLRITARLSGVGELDDPNDTDDDFQLAVEPRIAVASGAFFGSFGLLLNLDEPAGIFGDGTDNFPGIYAFRLMFGARI